MAKFRARKVPLLITTDVAARGIDIPLIDNVVNYDFPAKPELFVHRHGLSSALLVVMLRRTAGRRPLRQAVPVAAALRLA